MVLHILPLPHASAKARSLIQRSPHSWGVVATLTLPIGVTSIFFKKLLVSFSDGYSLQKHAGFWCKSNAVGHLFRAVNNFGRDTAQCTVFGTVA